MTFRVVIDWACNDTNWIREKVKSSISRFGEGVGVFEIGRAGCSTVKAPAPTTPKPTIKTPPNSTPANNPPPAAAAAPNNAGWDTWFKQNGMYMGAALVLILVVSRRS